MPIENMNITDQKVICLAGEDNKIPLVQRRRHYYDKQKHNEC